MSEMVLYEDEQMIVWAEDTNTSTSRRVEWKSGTAPVNRTNIDTAITNALAELRMMRDYPALPTVPSGTMTTAQLSNAMRTLRDEAQTNRQGIQRVCSTLIGTIRLLRGDFDDVG